MGPAENPGETIRLPTASAAATGPASSPAAHPTPGTSHTPPPDPARQQRESRSNNEKSWPQLVPWKVREFSGIDGGFKRRSDDVRAVNGAKKPCVERWRHWCTP